ncbi:MAG TPA: response regulator transcription factor [Cytophagales bacterium]|nr:response regulator transcription factor [Cytophagales bacterium]
MLKLLIAEDYKIVREGLRALLTDEPNFDIVGEACSEKELIELLTSIQSDVVLMDFNLPEIDEVEITKRLIQSYPFVKILALSILKSEEHIKGMIDAGVEGYILKTAGRDELVNAINMVYSGYRYVSPEITLNLLNKTMSDNASQKQINQNSKSQVSKRELEVLNLIADGFTNVEIADKLFTSKRTIESHRRNLIEKTHTKNTAELVKYALSNGLLI